MKRLYFLLIAFAAFAACKKTEDPNLVVCPNPNTKTILGDWKEAQTYASPGGLTNWKDVTDGGIITFKADSTFTATKQVYMFGTSGRISAINDSVFTVQTNGFPGKYSVRFKDNNTTMEVWYMYCTEGCGVRLKRITATTDK